MTSMVTLLQILANLVISHDLIIGPGQSYQRNNTVCDRHRTMYEIRLII